jgi:hypothetical protein
LVLAVAARVVSELVADRATRRVAPASALVRGRLLAGRGLVADDLRAELRRRDHQCLGPGRIRLLLDQRPELAAELFRERVHSGQEVGSGH